ncbi:MAG: RNA 2',3'-cyclic phosphodiesterase [Gemmataceae bacterium]|nr:RNA 2',3'-cyclic phosphodiesterase [Gemmataceae bacterium]
MTRTRTFIAIDPGKEIRARLVALQEQLGRSGAEVKWVEPANLHVTLLFLGEVDERDLPAVCWAVGKAAATQPGFAMTVERASCFGNPRRPRTLWAGVGDGTQAVCALHDAIEAPLLELGCYRREERQFTPHITLGRVRSERSADGLATALARQAGWRGGETLVRAVHVMGSELTPQGPIYTVLSRAQLG